MGMMKMMMFMIRVMILFSGQTSGVGPGPGQHWSRAASYLFGLALVHSRFRFDGLVARVMLRLGSRLVWVQSNRVNARSMLVKEVKHSQQKLRFGSDMVRFGFGAVRINSVKPSQLGQRRSTQRVDSVDLVNSVERLKPKRIGKISDVTIYVVLIIFKLLT
ncbi:hypothetical protein Hanom_Chr17g01566981 [Helianthus anomalus]